MRRLIPIFAYFAVLSLLLSFPYFTAAVSGEESGVSWSIDTNPVCLDAGDNFTLTASATAWQPADNRMVNIDLMINTGTTFISGADPVNCNNNQQCRADWNMQMGSGGLHRIRFTHVYGAFEQNVNLAPVAANTICFEPPIRSRSFEALLDEITNYIFYIAIILSPLMIIIAGFYFVTAGGNPQHIQRAKDIIFWTVVGLTIVLLAKGLVVIVRQIAGA